MVTGAGLMMALFGLKLAQRKKKKTDQKLKSNWLIIYFSFIFLSAIKIKVIF